MKKVTVQVEDYLYDFYRKVGQKAGGIAVERLWQTRCLSWPAS